MKPFLLPLLLALTALPVFSQRVMSTVAGSPFVFRSDGKPATTASLGTLTGIASDAAGNIYAADDGNHIVVKISTDGTLTVVAGNGLGGFSGEGGEARSASLSGIQLLDSLGRLAADQSGNVYIADAGNGRIRKVNSQGIITTIAGGGRGGDGGPATQASLNIPLGVAVDGSGNVYITELISCRIRKVNAQGTISTVAGNGTCGFSGDNGPATSAQLQYPRGAVSVAADGSIYIGDTNNHRVRRVSPSGVITTVAGNGQSTYAGDGGPALNASFNYPFSVSLLPAGGFIVADYENHRIRKVDANGVITTVAGSGTQGFSGDGSAAGAASLNNPMQAVARADGSILIADSTNYRVRSVSASGTITTVGGNGLFKFFGDGGPAITASLNDPEYLALDGAGNLLILENRGNRLRKVTPAGIITTVAGIGIAGFSGDGGPASSSSLNFPAGIAVGPDGNYYIADRVNRRVRKVSPSGIITTVAGNGNLGFGGDGGPATQATLGFIQGVGTDTAGNLYIVDSSNNAIRKVTPSGIISNFAGVRAVSAAAGFSGDGGPATSATLNAPSGVAADSVGNIYFTDRGNGRVRKINTSGVISTIAGTGTQGFSGDGGAATAAQLNYPDQIAVTSDGSIYVADFFNHRIRKIDASGVISTVAGGGSGGDGSLAASASLDIVTGVAVDGAGTIYIADGTDRVRAVLGDRPTYTAAPASVVFTAQAGAAASGPQTISLASTIAGVSWTARVGTSSGSWLTITPAAGKMPGTIELRADATRLAVGQYQEVVIVDAPVTSTGPQTIAVNFNVLAQTPASLSLEPTALTFNGVAGSSNPAPAQLTISNSGGGTLSWTAQASTASGGAWLTLSAASGTASPGSPSTIQIFANTTGLAVGAYSGSVRVANAANSSVITAGVTLIVAASNSTMLLSQTGLTFTGVENGAAVPGDTFGVLNTGAGSMTWSATASTFAGGNWLTVAPTSGVSVAASTAVPLVTVQVNPAGLRAGSYSGVIRVESTGAANSPQFVAVFFQVLPAGTAPPFQVRPSGLIFVRQAGTSDPGSQSVRIATSAPGDLQAVRGAFTRDGGNWLNTFPDRIGFSASQPAVFTIAPALGNLAPGTYFGAMALLFSDNTSQTVNVLFVITPSAAGSAADGAFAGIGPTAAGCTPQRLFVTVSSLGSSFTSPVGYPATLEATVRDDCANLVPNATVVASFSNGDPPVKLNSLQNGAYVGTWKPGTSASQVVITVRSLLDPLTPGSSQSQGAPGGGTSLAGIFPGGIVNAAGFSKNSPIAPGSIVSVFGRGIAATTDGATASLPLPVQLGGATLTIGGRDVPLFYSRADQINAQVPFDLPASTNTPVFVKLTAAGTPIETITIAPAAPGIFVTSGQQGAILDGQGRLKDAASPAAVGDTVVIYATGLGATNPAVASGQVAPANPTAQVVTLPQVTFGGVQGTVVYAGLTAGFVGLYQVNVQIPPGVPLGNAVPVVIIQNGVSSNVTSMAVR